MAVVVVVVLSDVVSKWAISQRSRKIFRCVFKSPEWVVRGKEKS